MRSSAQRWLTNKRQLAQFGNCRPETNESCEVIQFALMAESRPIAPPRRNRKKKGPAKDEVVLRSRVITALDNEGLGEVEVDARVLPAIRKCLEFLNKPSSLKEEGLFRVPGNQRIVQEIYQQLDEGDEVDFSKIREASNVCGLLKRCLREEELPIDPLTAKRLLKSIDRSHSHAQRLRRVRRTLAVLSAMRFSILRSLVLTFRKIIATPGNLMNASNLTTAVGPTIFPTLPIQKTGVVLEFLVVYYVDLFTPEVIEIVSTAKPAPSPRASRPSSTASAPASTRSLSSKGSGMAEPRLQRLLALLGEDFDDGEEADGQDDSGSDVDYNAMYSDVTPDQGMTVRSF
eukprot:TRINITY_DN12341_c5_g1_i1.p1 TRINITY_DN12341_c5_g1~~TRINITY_DN12341_c5_g1_i1.p1  ORF type:complete len:345 (+),score=61.36 TRINITY_DN12341_c5_g1_i1:193-1227(+)